MVISLSELSSLHEDEGKRSRCASGSAYVGKVRNVGEEEFTGNRWAARANLSPGHEFGRAPELREGLPVRPQAGERQCPPEAVKLFLLRNSEANGVSSVAWGMAQPPIRPGLPSAILPETLPIRRMDGDER